MTSDTAVTPGRRVTPGDLLRIAGGLVLGSLLGALVAVMILGGRVTAEARLVVGDQTIAAQSVPGYALATQQLAGTYARLVMGDAVTSQVPEDAEVSASPVPESAVVRVQAEADDADTAVAAANAAAQALVTSVQGVTGPETDEAQVTAWQEARARLREAQSAAAAQTSAAGAARAQDIVALRELEVEALAQAYREAVRASASGSASLAVTQAAAVTTTSTPRAGVLGAFAGAALAALLLGALHLLRSRGRP